MKKPKKKDLKLLKELEQVVEKRPLRWADVAKRMDVSRSTIRRWRKGQAIPSSKNLKKIKSAISSIEADYPLQPPEERHKACIAKLGHNEDTWYTKRGRKTLFREAMMEEGRKLAGLAMTIEEIAVFWRVGYSTLKRWAKQKPEFKAALNEGRLQADKVVEEKLHSRATGYDYTERHYDVEYVDDAEAPGGVKATKMLRKEIVKHAIPDVTAQIIWLRNRRSDKWHGERGLSLFGLEGEAVSIRFVEEKPNRNKEETPPPIDNSEKKEETK